MVLNIYINKNKPNEDKNKQALFWVRIPAPEN